LTEEARHVIQDLHLLAARIREKELNFDHETPIHMFQARAGAGDEMIEEGPHHPNHYHLYPRARNLFLNLLHLADESVLHRGLAPHHPEDDDLDRQTDAIIIEVEVVEVAEEGGGVRIVVPAEGHQHQVLLCPALHDLQGDGDLLLRQ
jgi:hypothetical protein